MTCLCLGTGMLLEAAEEANSANNDRIAEFYDNFPKSDADDNGVLTVAEMSTFIMAKVKSSATSKNFPPLKRLLKKAPEAALNQDGVLTKTELIKHLNQ